MQYVKNIKPHEFSPSLAKRFLLGRLDIELTERCNNECIHCLINQPEHDADIRAKEMDAEFIKDILRQAADLGCLTVRFTGGEPLLREDFSELYVYARRLGMRVILFTNARKITPEIARLLERIPPGHRVEVTVYGMHAESYDAAAASPGAFTEFRCGIDLLRVHQIPFIVKPSLLPPNLAEIDEFEAFVATLPSMDKMPGLLTDFDLRARRDNAAKNRFIETLRYTPDEIIAMLARDPLYVNEMSRFCGKFIGPPGDQLFRCGAGHGICVDAYGKAQMCMGLRHPDMVYDLRGTALEEANGRSSLRYALTEIFPILRGARAKNPEYLRRCARCFLKGLCEQCPAKSWMEHGTLDTPVDYQCRVAHAQARYLGLIAENENAWETADWRERILHFTGEGFFRGQKEIG